MCWQSRHRSYCSSIRPRSVWNQWTVLSPTKHQNGFSSPSSKWKIKIKKIVALLCKMVQSLDRISSGIQGTMCRATAKYAYLSVTAKTFQTTSAGYPTQEPKEIKLNHKLYRIAYIVQQLLAFCCQWKAQHGRQCWMQESNLGLLFCSFPCTNLHVE